MNECGVCKSKIKSLLYCNGCFQRAKSVAERRGRIEELKLLEQYCNNNYDLNELGLRYYIKDRVIELEKGDLK
jgi:hypothetical protein